MGTGRAPIEDGLGKRGSLSLASSEPTRLRDGDRPRAGQCSNDGRSGEYHTITVVVIRAFG
jgi:hypothetical protein